MTDGRFVDMDAKIEIRPDCQLRLECIRIASENLKISHGQALEYQVLDYAEKLFQYIAGQLKQAA